GLHGAFFAATLRRIGGTVPEASTCHCTFDAFIAASAVSVPRTARKCWRTQTIDVGGFFRIAVAGDAIGIAESTGLYFVDGRNDGGWCGAAAVQIIHFYFVARP